MFKKRLSRNTVSAVLLGLCFFLFSLGAHADGIFIPATKRADMVHDNVRGVLYITNGAQILRYKLATKTFLSPLQLSGNLKGIDISPDGNFLAVANIGHSATKNWIYLVNLKTWTATQVNFTLGISEGGTYAVAYDNMGKILITSQYMGSGWVPIRRYDPATKAVTTLGSVRQNSMVRANANGSVIAVVEANSSSGPFGKYNVSTEDLSMTGSTNWFNFEVAVNPSGTRFAIPTYNGTYIMNSNFLPTGTLIGANAGGQPIGAAFHPTKPRVYFPWALSKYVRIYDTQTWKVVGQYNFANTFDHTGNTAYVEGRVKTSKDGGLLFVTVAGGVRYIATQ